MKEKREATYLVGAESPKGGKHLKLTCIALIMVQQQQQKSFFLG